MPDLMNRDKHFSDVTRLYRNAKGESRIAYRTVLDLICDSEIISGGKIGELCEQIKELAVDISRRTFDEDTSISARMIFDMACAIQNEVTTESEKFGGIDIAKEMIQNAETCDPI